jgi:hypothetical protein
VDVVLDVVVEVVEVESEPLVVVVVVVADVEVLAGGERLLYTTWKPRDVTPVPVSHW